MTIPFILLHGTLGWADELIFISVVVIFLIAMAVAWAMMRARGVEDGSTEPKGIELTEATDQNDQTDRFQLD